MAIIEAGGNFVYAYDPLPGDDCVSITWHGPDERDTRYLKPFVGGPWPISEHQAIVDWAVSMAGFMRWPLHVLTKLSDEGADRPLAGQPPLGKVWS